VVAFDPPVLRQKTRIDTPAKKSASEVRRIARLTALHLQKGEASLPVVGTVAVARAPRRGDVPMKQRRARGVLKVRRRDAPEALKRAKLMEKGLGDNAALFPIPNPPLPVFSNQIVVTDKAQVAVGKGGKGTAAARDVELGLLTGMMGSELVYIQSVADTGNPDEAVHTLRAGGVEVAGFGQHDKAILTVTQGPTSGSVGLEANAHALLGDNLQRKHFFSWEYTTDGKTFVSMPSTPEVKTTLTGLTPLTTVGFRVAVTVSKSPMGPWSQVLPTHLVEQFPAVELRAVA
jgi:hypothetical protein